ncbi:hypothetical protein [Anaerocolumna xylanovorans]|uniref:hypothetical protein n=1 Tax=Anaerocolumna xylanovorans TaxID=100134 RepID=UPI001588136B|nr:hypothetical protein [Anaerocolumna xylanovorans]
MNSKPNKPKTTNVYDDGNIPEIDLPHPSNYAESDDTTVEPPPESSRPRKEGPEGD